MRKKSTDLMALKCYRSFSQKIKNNSLSILESCSNFSDGNLLNNLFMKTMAKLNELSFELLPHPSYSPYLAPSNYWLFGDLKKMLQGKRFGSKEEVFAETEAYFESRDESFYKKGIGKLEKRWNECITLEGNYVDE